jgi:hypothetical protein
LRRSIVGTELCLSLVMGGSAAPLASSDRYFERVSIE